MEKQSGPEGPLFLSGEHPPVPEMSSCISGASILTQLTAMFRKNIFRRYPVRR